MKEVIEKYIQVNHFGRFMEMEFTITAPGEIVYTLPVRTQLLATETAAHGGALAGLMDAVLGVAALSAVAEEQKRVATLELKISYFGPAIEGDLITGKGHVIKKGKRIVFSEGELYNQKNELIAKGSGTFTAYPIQEK